MKKTIVKVFVFLLCLFASLELGSFLIVEFGNLAPEGLTQAYKQTLPAWFDPSKKTSRYDSAFQTHPFWGHQLKQGNNHGFAEINDFPYKKSPDQQVIGVFGGSTAEHWARWMQTNELFKNRGHNNIVVLNFALSGMKQPQQFAVASRFMDSIDVALFYDGYNEVVSNSCPLDPEASVIYKYLTQLKTNEEFWFRGKMLNHVTQTILQSPISRSHFVFYLWDRFKESTFRKLNKIKNEFEGTTKKSDFSVCQNSKDELIDHRFKIWKKYTELTKLIADDYSVKMLHFLQPDPFKKNVKKLSEEEMAIVQWQRNNHTQPDSKGHDTQTFRQLYQATDMDFSHDLSEIFKGVEEPTYSDAHSHLNNRGYKILSETVYSILLRENLISAPK